MMLLYNHDYTARGYEDGSEYYPGTHGLFEKQKRQADGHDHTELVYRSYPRDVAGLESLEIEQPRQACGKS